MGAGVGELVGAKAGELVGAGVGELDGAGVGELGGRKHAGVGAGVRLIIRLLWGKVGKRAEYSAVGVITVWPEKGAITNAVQTQPRLKNLEPSTTDNRASEDEEEQEEGDVPAVRANRSRCARCSKPAASVCPADW